MVNSRQVFDSEAIGNARSVTELDAFIGLRIKKRRGVLGLTQWQLADQIGISFQQLHKYEAGLNRVPAHRLNEIARALGAPLEYFFEAPPDDTKGDHKSSSNARRTADELALESQIKEFAGMLRGLPTNEARARLMKLIRFVVRDLD